MKNFWLNRKQTNEFIMWGEKSTALDRVYLRRAVLAVRKQIYKIIKDNIFEPEDKVVEEISKYLFSIFTSDFIDSYCVNKGRTTVYFVGDVKMTIVYETKEVV